MATIKARKTGEARDIRCEVNGADILCDVLGGSGVDHDGETWVVDDEEELDWWERWATREERITDAYERANKKERQEYERAINGWGHDLEALQDAQEIVLGLAGYEVMVTPKDETCSEVFLSERYATEEEAVARFEEIIEEGGWGDGDEISVWQNFEDQSSVSLLIQDL